MPHSQFDATCEEVPLELASSVVDFDPHSALGDGFQKLIRGIDGRCSGVNCLGEHNPGSSFGFRLRRRTSPWRGGGLMPVTIGHG
jgi:hypothetical protein